MTEISENQPQQPLPSDPVQPAQESAVPPPPQPYATPLATAAYAPRKKSPSALKIVLIVVGIVVGLGLIAAGVGGFFLYKVFKSSHITTSSQPVTAADLGVPIYPGAVQGKASVRMTIAGKDMLTTSFLTIDSKDRVIAFYQSNLGSYAKSTNSSRGESFVVDKGNGESVIVTVQQNPSIADGQTQIVIIHATKAAPQSN